MNHQILQDIHDDLNFCLAIMDEKGKRNPEDNSEMLWDSDWVHLRTLILGCHDRMKRYLEAMRGSASVFEEWLEASE